MSKTLPKDLTSYDFLKSIAVLLMIVDHVGYYFYPEENWFRVVGRACVPLWFFLIGYAQSRGLSKDLWIGGAMLVLANIVVGSYLLSLNILFSMLIVRMVLDPLLDAALRSVREFALITFSLTLVMLPTIFLWEYGTQGIMIAMLGYMIRNRERIKALHPDAFEIFYVVNVLLFIGFQSFIFMFNKAEIVALSILSVISFVSLYYFRPMTFPELTAKLPRHLVRLLQFGGRKTLEIYVVHLLLFKIMAMVLFPDSYSWFQVKLFVFQ